VRSQLVMPPLDFAISQRLDVLRIAVMTLEGLEFTSCHSPVCSWSTKWAMCSLPRVTFLVNHERCAPATVCITVLNIVSSHKRTRTREQLVNGVHRLVVAAGADAALLAQAVELVDEQDARRLDAGKQGRRVNGMHSA